MRRFYIFVLLSMCLGLAGARSMYNYRYWFDNDESNAVSLSGDENLKIDIALDGLPENIHTLHFQVSDSDGVVSSPQTTYFVKAPASGERVLTYWFDDDENVRTLSEGASVIDVSNLSDNLHILHVQCRGKSPSATRSTFFIKVPQIEGVAYLRVVTSIDGAIYSQEDVAPNGTLLHYDFDASVLSEGLHLLSAQVVTPSGVATSVWSSFFLRVATDDEIGRMKCFYSIDGDSGKCLVGV